MRQNLSKSPHAQAMAHTSLKLPVTGPLEAAGMRYNAHGDVNPCEVAQYATPHLQGMVPCVCRRKAERMHRIIAAGPCALITAEENAQRF